MNFDEWFASFDAEGMLPMALLRKAFNDATTAEREECAQLCEKSHTAFNHPALIRARSEK